MARRPPSTSPGSWRSSLTLALALACQSSGEADDTDDTGDTTAAQTSAAVTTGMLESSSSSSESTGFPEPPPPECGPLTACGVQCTDVMSDPNNCGQCGVSCVLPRSEPACTAGACAVGTCEPGWADCDHDVDNGCELALGPGVPCPFMCQMGAAEQCNLQDDNCDGQCDDGALPGCRQGVHRASSPTIGHLYTLDAGEAMSGDLSPEALDFFFTYTAPQPGLAPLYRCLKGNGKRLLTLDGACEGAGSQEGILGHVAGDGACGAVPLFRLYSGAKQEHFYTTSEAERDNAVAMFGYVYESVAANVWSAP